MKIHRTKQINAGSKADMESDRPMDRLVCGDVGLVKQWHWAALKP
jgi:transcription-repair coupling factor (superfamily II helicase)